MPSRLRRRLIEREKEQAELPLSRQAVLLGIGRASLYYQPVGPSEREIALKHRIDEIYTVYPFYGYRRIHAQLGREGHSVNRKTVQGYMREMGFKRFILVPISPSGIISTGFIPTCCGVWQLPDPCKCSGRTLLIFGSKAAGYT